MDVVCVVDKEIAMVIGHLLLWQLGTMVTEDPLYNLIRWEKMQAQARKRSERQCHVIWNCVWSVLIQLLASGRIEEGAGGGGYM